MNQLVGPLLLPVTRWAESSQRRACRNAMIASTALTTTRRERDEAQAYVDAALAQRARRAGAVPPSLPAARLG